MTKHISIKLKAALLLIVFSLNTVIGFACAIGVDMSFNTTHHHDEDTAIETSVHQHADGKKHEHHHDSKEGSEKAGCCNDSLIKFQNLDKSLNQTGNVVINVPVFVALLSSYFGIEIFKQTHVFNQKYIFDFFHPPPPDIRILIQSFQI